ncbi:RICIN domain-containing protein [Streptomyces sp. NRRL S-350]|uniref:RICIN domain-containing protein n=1 Tax=Streptomyces sp. NRRL S-350 TaxID=1463902 RepID=UPI0004C07212|nr:RICIN domain-containing protein [Streptomyces sp. NRRL S-350]
MPATANPGRTAPWLRLLAALLVTCCAALGLTAAPARAASGAPAASAASCASPQQCLTIKSLSNGRQLDVQNGNTGDGAYVVTNSAPGYHQNWHLSVSPGDSSFTIVNNDTGKCIDLASWFTPGLRQQTCAGQASQRWFLQPAPGGGADSFMIRHVGDNTCLDLLAGAQYDDAWTDQYTCNGTANQQWATGFPEAARNLAVDHAAKQCQKDPSSCSWAVTSEAPAAPLPRACASSVWFNNTSGAVQQSFSVTDDSGWTNSIGVDMGSQIAGGAPGNVLTATISSTLHFTNEWHGSRSVNNSVTVTVPPQQYGWVTLAKVARKVTGTWTFDAHGIPWTADDTITVPISSDPVAGATLYIANTSPTFTTCA